MGQSRQGPGGRYGWRNQANCRYCEHATLAMEEYKVQIANAGDGGGVYPFSTFLHHHLAIQKAIDEDDLTPDRLRRIAADDEKLIAAVIELDRAWRAKRSVQKK